MRVRVVNTGSEPVTIPITPAQDQLQAILEREGWWTDERMHTGLVFPTVLTAGERASYPAARFSIEQLNQLETLREAGKIAVFVE